MLSALTLSSLLPQLSLIVFGSKILLWICMWLECIISCKVLIYHDFPFISHIHELIKSCEEAIYLFLSTLGYLLCLINIRFECALLFKSFVFLMLSLLLVALLVFMPFVNVFIEFFKVSWIIITLLEIRRHIIVDFRSKSREERIRVSLYALL